MDKNAVSITNQFKASLQKASAENIVELTTWFPNNEALKKWGGPGLSIPVHPDNMSRHLQAHDFKSFAWLHHTQMVGFGQYQVYMQYLHLGRLVINPKYRGKGWSRSLVNALINNGLSHTSIDNTNIQYISLYVYPDNIIAHQLYLKMGFKKAKPPQGFRDVAGSEFLTLACSPLKN